MGRPAFGTASKGMPAVGPYSLFCFGLRNQFGRCPNSTDASGESTIAIEASVLGTLLDSVVRIVTFRQPWIDLPCRGLACRTELACDLWELVRKEAVRPIRLVQSPWSTRG